MGGLALAGSVMAWGWFDNKPEWTEWQGFKNAFISTDGRVVDHSQADKRTVSEGQAYAMFFALVANDKATFEKLLAWTQNNLSNGDLRRHLPAWHWGSSNAAWGVIDGNSASDADVLIAYTLLEASRLWCKPSYAALASGLAEKIQSDEVMWVNGLGRTLLPGNVGFVKEDGRVKLNPSYVPTFVMARLADHFRNDQRWAELYLGSQQLLIKSQKAGLYPDWLWVNNGAIEPLDHPGDYDAIRVYLWLGLADKNDPTVKALWTASRPFLAGIAKLGFVPEQWNAEKNSMLNSAGPAGFQHALAPLRNALGLANSVKLDLNVPSDADADAWRAFGYYTSALTLFAKGFIDKHYSVDTTGKLQLQSLPQGASCG